MDVRITPSLLKGIIIGTPSYEMASKILLSKYLTNKSISETIFASYPEPEKYRSEKLKTFIDGVTSLRDNAPINCNNDDELFYYLSPLLCDGEKQQVFNNIKINDLKSFKNTADILMKHGCEISLMENTLYLSGKLKCGRFVFDSDAPHQIISGLLYKLPLLNERSVITIKKPYNYTANIKMTLTILERHGIQIKTSDNGQEIVILIVGGQRYYKKGPVAVDGSWLNASPWIGINLFRDGHKIVIEKLSNGTLQPQMVIFDFAQEFRKEKRILDMTSVPDLFPIVAVVSLMAPGETIIKNIDEIINHKKYELDSLFNLFNIVKAKYELVDSELRITSIDKYIKNDKNVVIDACNDPMLIMAYSILANSFKFPIVIKNIENIKEIYPNFFLDFIAMGGKCEPIQTLEDENVQE